MARSSLVKLQWVGCQNFWRCIFDIRNKAYCCSLLHPWVVRCNAYNKPWCRLFYGWHNICTQAFYMLRMVRVFRLLCLDGTWSLLDICQSWIVLFQKLLDSHFPSNHLLLHPLWQNKIHTRISPLIWYPDNIFYINLIGKINRYWNRNVNQLIISFRTMITGKVS